MKRLLCLASLFSWQQKGLAQETRLSRADSHLHTRTLTDARENHPVAVQERAWSPAIRYTSQ